MEVRHLAVSLFIYTANNIKGEKAVKIKESALALAAIATAALMLLALAINMPDMALGAFIFLLILAWLAQQSEEKEE